MIDLEFEDRLRAEARHATRDLTIDDPSDHLVVPAHDASVRPRRRRKVVVGRLATAAAAAAVVGVVVLNLVAGDASTPSQVDAAGGGVVVDPASSEPAARLRDAIDATLASESFTMRTTAVVLDTNLLVQAPSGDEVDLPSITGTDDSRESLTTVDGQLVAQRWSIGGVAGPVLTIRDLTTSSMLAQVAPGAWQRWGSDEATIVEQLRHLADQPCVTRPDVSDPSTLVVSVDDPTGCTGRLGGTEALVRRWTVSLRPDGRVASIRPVRDDDAVLADTRSDQFFDGYDSSPVTLPDPAAVTEVEAPRGLVNDTTTGYARPVDTVG